MNDEKIIEGLEEIDPGDPLSPDWDVLHAAIARIRELAEARKERDEAVGLLLWLSANVEFHNPDSRECRPEIHTEADNKIDDFLSRVSANEEPTDD